MSTTVDNYLFLGLPQSGKTTCFSLMAQHLQDVANHTSHLRFLYLPTKIVNKETNEVTYDEITSDFIDDCISRIHNQRWPRKTEDYEAGYSFELDKFFTFRGKPVLQKYFYRKSVIDYHDYPGEAFEAAFGVGEDPTPDMQKIAADMKSRIMKATGLFLILDAEALFNGTDKQKLKKTLTRLFERIKEYNPNVKLAIIFNKLELFDGNEPDFVEKFKKDYSNVYAFLPYNHRFFNVYPLGNVCTAENGSIFPPKNLSPRNILAPAKWMLNSNREQESQMKVHVTRAGKVIATWFLIGGAIFFMLGGASIISKMVENHRVRIYPKIDGTFKNTDISYKDWNTLKMAFAEHYKKISDALDHLKKLKGKYPNNKELDEKVKNYQLYLDSMRNASFECPEHINSGTEQKSKKCSCCGGDGTHVFLWTCDECKGTGKIYYNVSTTQKCPHCRAENKSRISAQWLLH